MTLAELSNLLCALLLVYSLSVCQACGAGEYQQDSDCKKCADTIPGCAECSSAKSCVRCSRDDFFLLDEDSSPGYEKCSASCQGRDRFQTNSSGTNVCQICSKLPGNKSCLECLDESKCLKCSSNQYLPRYLERSADNTSVYCVTNCSSGALLVLNNSIGTGRCEFCSNIVDPDCSKCTRHLNESFSPFFYKCTECANMKKLTYVKRSIETMLSSLVTYQVTCTSCNTSDSRRYVSGDECIPCEKTWANCTKCISNETTTRCLSCAEDTHLDMGAPVEKRSCITCPAGSAKVKNKDTGQIDCFPCKKCVNCEDETMICRECEEGLRAMLPEALVCGICDKTSHRKVSLPGQRDNYCVEAPKVPLKTSVTYDNVSWVANITLYCSHPSKVFWMAGVDDEYLSRTTVDSVKAALQRKYLYINNSRDPYYRIYGYDEARARSLISPSSDNASVPGSAPVPAYPLTVMLDKYLKANSKYRIVHFCENDFGITTELAIASSGAWEVQDNLSRDIRIGVWLSSAPVLRNKVDLACALAELLGGLGTEKRIISDAGLSCWEGREVLKSGSNRVRLLRMLQGAGANISTLGENYTSVFIEKDYYMRDDSSSYARLLSTVQSDRFADELKKKALVYSIAIQKIDYEVKGSTTIPSLRQYPVVFVSLNQSFTAKNPDLNVSTVKGEGFFFVEFQLFYSDAVIYTALGEQSPEEPAPSAAQFLKGLNHRNATLKNFTAFRAPVNTIYRFTYRGLKQGKSYQFFIAQGDEYPAPHQAVSDVQMFNIGIPVEMVVVEFTDSSQSEQDRDLGLGLGLGLGLPILGCVIFAIIKAMQRLKRRAKERERGKTTNPVMTSEAAKELQMED